MVSVVLSAVSGGLFEIGDDLPTLGKSPDRLAWLKNRDLLDMVQLGRASKPADLLTYHRRKILNRASSFFEGEAIGRPWLLSSTGQKVRAVMTCSLSQLGLNEQGSSRSNGSAGVHTRKLQGAGPPCIVEQPAHSVRLLKLIDGSAPAQTPAARITSPQHRAAKQASI